MIGAQKSFSGGLNVQLDPSKIGDSEYPRLQNGRTRFDTVQPILKPALQTLGLPAGLVQGCYGAGQFSVVFVAGRAYFRDCSVVGSAWSQVTGFQMSATQPVIYAELVPASSINLNRVPEDTTQPSSGLKRLATITGSPTVILCQDGVNQPWIILPDGTARVTQGFSAWTQANPEYVPIGFQMAYVPQEAVLYMVLKPTAGQPTTNNKIARSVTGQPLNFAVALDSSGNALSEQATIDLSFSVSYDSITCLKATNSNEGSLFVGTLRSSFLVQPNKDPLTFLFGEPSIFQTIPLFTTGPLNQFSVTELSGDMALVDFSGIRSFNAVLQAKREGQNTPFSARVSRLFEGVSQIAPCCVNFDDYALFAVNTIYGQVLIVFDTVTGAYTAIDAWSIDGYIKQFAEVKAGGLRYLFFYTSNNKVYQAYAGAAVETVRAYIGEWMNDDARVSQKPISALTNFVNVLESGTVYATLFVDSVAGATKPQPLSQTTVSQTPPIPFPLGYSSSDLSKNITFNFPEAKSGDKVGIYLTWDFNATLLEVQLISNDLQSNVSLEQQIRDTGQVGTSPVSLVSFSPASGVVSTVVTVRGNGLTRVTGITVGGVAVNSFTLLNAKQLTFVVPASAQTGRIKLLFNNGFVESVTDFTVT